MEVKKTRVAIIGLGLWGARAHLPVLAARDDVEVVAIVEPYGDEGPEVARQYGVARFERDAEALWRDPDGIDAAIIATPVDTHRDLVVSAFANGLHVLCEKPLAYDVAQAEEMHRAARESGKVAKMGFLFRFSPVVEKMKQLVDEGYIGTVQLLESHTVNAQFVDPARPRHWKMQRDRANGGVYSEYGSHAIDLAMWFGGPIDKVVAHGVTVVGERPLVTGGTGIVDVDDASTTIATFVNGGEASFQKSWSSYPVGGGGFRIYGSRGSLAWQQDLTTRKSECLIAATVDNPEPHVLFEFTPPFDARTDEGVFPLGLLARYNRRLIDSFMEDIAAGRSSGPSFEDGLAVQQVLSAIRTSLDDERWVTV